MTVINIVLLLLYFKGVLSYNTSKYKFHNSFSFGVATSAYQVEGAWNLSGKGVSVWDYITHNTPEIIADGSNGDIACDSFHKIDEDIELLKLLGVNHYRFSIAWSRILPTGMKNEINWEGIQYYDRLISKLLEAEIEPWVTIYHFDLPYSLHILGSWFQSEISNYIVEYADLLFYTFGDRVKTWITINEPYSICVNGLVIYGAELPTGIAEYICARNILRAHAAIYHLYKDKYQSTQKGKLSMAFNLQAYLPASDKPADIEAAERATQFAFGWFVHPIIWGNYPQIMIDDIQKYSQSQGFSQSRLAELSAKDILQIFGTADFIGLNNYETYLVSANNSTIDKTPSYENDAGITIVKDPGWNETYAIKMKSIGLGVILKWIQKTYNNPEIRIMEQGLPDNDTTLLDYNRHQYLLNNLEQILKNINEDHVKVTGYTFWSFMDNFEWQYGYTKRYGLNYVDFNHPDRLRVPRLSSVTYSFVTKNRSLAGLV